MKIESQICECFNIQIRFNSSPSPGVLDLTDMSDPLSFGFDKNFQQKRIDLSNLLNFIIF